SYGAGGGGGGRGHYVGGTCCCLGTWTNTAGGGGAPGCIVVIYTPAVVFVAPQWGSSFDVAEAPIWRPRAHGASALALLYNVKFFSAPGQVPTKFWRYDFDDQLPKWQGKPGAAAPIQLPAA